MDRQRLTITLREDLLRRLDEIIDGVQIRNRSHAIEYLLSQSLTPKVSQAIILAGGQGVKMRPLTYEIPKPLIPVHGRPLVEYTLEILREAGIRDIIMAIGHLGDKVKETLGNGQKYGVKITYSEERRALGTAGAVRNAFSHLSKKPFLVINGDVLTKIDLGELVNFHQEDKYLATIALSTASESRGWGTALVRGEKIVKFFRQGQRSASRLVNAGIYIFSPAINNYIPKKQKINVDNIFPDLAKEGKLAGFVFEAQWFDISTPKIYEKAIKEWK